MKKTALLLTAMLSGAGLQAQILPYSVSVDVGYTSEYVFRGIQRASDSFQGSVELLAEGGYAGLWTNQPLLRRQENEVNFYLGYMHGLGGGLALDGGATHYWYPEARGGGTKYSTEGFLGLTADFRGFTPSLYGYYDIRLKSYTVQAAFGYSIPLANLGTSMDFSIFAGSVTGRDLMPDSDAEEPVRDWYGYYGADISIPFQLNPTSTFTVGGHVAADYNLGFRPSKTNLWFTVALSTGF
jgi:uncharacterized protein (TIGR02001 family)